MTEEIRNEYNIKKISEDFIDEKITQNNYKEYFERLSRTLQVIYSNIDRYIIEAKDIGNKLKKLEKNNKYITSDSGFIHIEYFELYKKRSDIHRNYIPEITIAQQMTYSALEKIFTILKAMKVIDIERDVLQKFSEVDEKRYKFQEEKQMANLFNYFRESEQERKQLVESFGKIISQIENQSQKNIIELATEITGKLHIEFKDIYTKINNIKDTNIDSLNKINETRVPYKLVEPKRETEIQPAPKIEVNQNTQEENQTIFDLDKDFGDDEENEVKS